jgi:hypothetical protein
MSNISHLKASVKVMAIPLVTAILLAVSAATAFADAADQDFPDNPIVAEHYFYTHMAQAGDGVTIQPGTAFFVQDKPAKPMRTMHVAKKVHRVHDMPRY